MTLRQFIVSVGATLLLTVGTSAPAHAQAYGNSTAPQPNPGVVLKITVTISRWEGDKKVGNSPYVLMVVPSWGERASKVVDGERTSLQMGSEYPLPPGADSKINYKALGTNITVAAHPVENGKYSLTVNVQDTQVDRPKPNTGLPSFQNFRSDNRLIMADGQTMQYTVATDAITGQIVKLDVTMNVVK